MAKTKGTWGGRREGAGRPPLAVRKHVPRRTRADFDPEHPVHVKLKLEPGLGSLKRPAIQRELHEVLRHLGARAEFRICYYAIHAKHVHLICEADDRHALARGVQVFCSMAARRINKVRDTRGRVFGDRYDAKALPKARAVREALTLVAEGDERAPTQPPQHRLLRRAKRGEAAG